MLGRALIPDNPTDAICGTNLIVRSQQALVVDHLQFARFEELCTFLELLVLSDNIFYFRETPLPGKLQRTFPQVLCNCDDEDVKSLIKKTNVEKEFNVILQDVFGYSAPALRPELVLARGKKQRLDDDLILDFRTRVAFHFEGRQNGLFNWLLQLLKDNGSEGAEARYFLRTFLYEAAGRTLKVSVAHDALRLPLATASGISLPRTNFLLYWAVVSAISLELSKNKWKLLIRPIPAVILSRCNGDRTQILLHAAELREQFRCYREIMAEFESLQEGNASLGEKQQAVNLVAQSMQLLVEAAKKLRKNQAWLKELATRFYESIRRSPITSIETGAGYTVSALLKFKTDRGARARVAPLFLLLEELAEVQSYPDFVEGLWPSTPFARAHPFHKVLEQCRSLPVEPV